MSLTAAPIVSQAGAITGITTVSRTIGGSPGVRGQVEAGAAGERGHSREAQQRFDAKVDAERRASREAQERFDIRVDAERRASREAQERFDIEVDAERRASREAQERFDIEVGAERRASREAQDQVEEEIESVRRDAWESRDRFDARRDAERRAATEQNELLQAQLQQAQRLENLGQLAGGIAHDFNNLLGVILSYATFVSEELGAASESDGTQRWETTRGDVGQIKLAAERATRLTHQLLAFARREVVRPQVLDLNADRHRRRGTAAPHPRRAHRILHRLPETCGRYGRPGPDGAGPGQPRGQRPRRHARRRHPEHRHRQHHRGRRLHRRRGSKARPGRYVRLRVSDTGAGMPADVIEHAFEPFFTTKPEGAGTGLGLATVHGIVTQAEGQIQIYSEPGAGTTFSIILPVTAEAAVAAAAHVPYQRAPKGETILVVEDEAALREVTERIFARNGYHVITAGSGPDAIDIVRGYDGEIHLLVTDVVMPQMLGKELAEKIRANSSRISRCCSCPATPARCSPRRDCLSWRGSGRQTVLRGGPAGQGRAGARRPLPGLQVRRGQPRLSRPPPRSAAWPADADSARTSDS